MQAYREGNKKNAKLTLKPKFLWILSCPTLAYRD